MDYEKMYELLFNQISKAIGEIEQSTVLTQEVTRGIGILKEAQRITENMYIEAAESKDE